MMKSVARLGSVAAFLLIAFATLSPIGLRPSVGNADLDRAGAFLLFGALLAMGFPSRGSRSLLLLTGIAVLLEALQFFDPGRDARIEDLAIKVLGGVVGFLATKSVTAVVRVLWNE